MNLESESYYVRRKGAIQGPWSMHKLKTEVKLRKLGRHHEVSQDGENWFQASAIEGLFPKSGRHSAEGPAQPVAVEWYYAFDGEQRGPHSEEEIVALIQDRTLRSTSLCWCDTFTDWLPLSDVDEFSSIVKDFDSSMTTATRLVDPTSIPPQHQGKKKTTLWAVASLVCGMLFMCLPFGMLAILFAVIAMFRINKDGQVGGLLYARIGLGLGVFSFIFLFMVLILGFFFEAVPSLTEIKEFFT